MSPTLILRWIVFAAPFALCVAWYSPTLSGAFLSDDYAVLDALSQWTQRGSILRGLLHQVHAGLESPSNYYYRPLTLITFGVNYALAGADPAPWRLVNLCLHLVNGALIFAIAQTLARGSRDGWSAIAAPAFASAVFLFFPTNPEAVAWVSGRYDLLATFLMLLTVVLFLRSTRPLDAWAVAAFVAAALALASKESAVQVAAWVAVAAIIRRSDDASPLQSAFRDAAPWFALTLAYFVLRTVIFGDPIRVYPGTSPGAALLGGDAFNVLGAAQVWFAALFPSPITRALFVGALVGLIAIGVARSWGRRDTRATWWLLVGAALLSIAIVLPHLQTLPADGEEGRLFYSTSAVIALLVSIPLVLPVAPRRSASWHAWAHGALAVAVGAFLVTELALLRINISAWATAGVQANNLLDDLPSLALSVPMQGYGFVLIPDHVGPVPFGRNAQGGMISPPTQAKSLASRLIVQTADDLSAWPAHIRNGLVDALRHYPLPDVLAEVAAGHAQGGVAPSNYFCWRVEGTGIVPMEFDPAKPGIDWLMAWRDALATGRCAVGPNAVPRK